MNFIRAEHLSRWLTRLAAREAPSAEDVAPAEVGAAAPRSFDERCAERLLAGESAALAEIYDAHHAALRGFAVRLLGDPVAAEDLVHDVFVALPASLRRFRNDCALRTFLMSIAVNLIRKHMRAAKRRRALLERYAELPQPGPLTAEAESVRRQAVDALRAALEALPEQQRVAFVLCEVEQCSAAEAGRIMGVPEATARSRVFHARRRLREWLGEDV